MNVVLSDEVTVVTNRNDLFLAPPPMKKVCSMCGKVHDAQSWARLPYVGTATYVDETLEMRNCKCGSTLAIVVEPERI